MFYYLFLNSNENVNKYTVLLEENYNKTIIKNIILFLFNSENFDNLQNENDVKIIMTLKELDNYRERLIDDKYIEDFLDNENSMKFLEESLMGEIYEKRNDIKYSYKKLVNFISYINKNNFNRILIKSGSIYMLYGLRKNSDIDFFSMENYNFNFKETELDYKIMDKNHPQYFRLTNPDKYFIFKGIKFSNLYDDLVYTRYYRTTREELKHPKAYADILMVKHLVYPKIKLPNNIYDLTKEQQDRILKNIKNRYDSDYNPFKEFNIKPSKKLIIKEPDLNYTKKSNANKKSSKSSVNNVNKQNGGSIKPMGAVILEKKLEKIIYPADAQPKLDGFRGIVIKKGDIFILSRNGNIYPHLEKIKKELETFPLIKKGYALDGELYCHGVPLKKLRSVLGRKTLTNNVKNLESKINYYIFDVITEDVPSHKRLQMLKDAFKNWKSNKIHLVKTTIVKSLQEVNKLREQYINDGYEGIIVRNRKGLYNFGKTSTNVFRSKNFKENFFKIVDGIEGKGANKGTVIWKLQCLKDKNKTFRARPVGTKAEREKLFKNKEMYIGKQIKIKYYEMDDKTGCVSRHPIALFIE